MASLNPFPDSRDIAIVLCIGDKRLNTQWPMVPRIGEVVHGYMMGTRFFSGRVLSVEHHFDEEEPTIEVRLPSNSWRDQ